MNIFVTVVSRLDDPFLGFYEDMADENYAHIQLSENQTALVYKVEYSVRKYTRCLYYSQIYKQIEEEIKTIALASEDEKISIYTSDEGVWGEVFSQMRSRISIKTGKVIELINIQHGFFDVLVTPENPSFLRIRRTVNKIFILLTGYPVFGLGFGGSLLDAYHVYDESSMHFLHKKGIDNVFVSPRKIKRSLFKRFQVARDSAKNKEQASGLSILFVMPHFIKEPTWQVECKQFLDFLAPVAEEIVSSGAELILRVHPGMPQTSWRREYETHRISEFTSVDENSDITDSFVTATHVMSVNSTALFEAMLLGIPALKLETPFIQTELQYPHTKIFTEHAMKSQIPGLDHEIGT